MGTRRIAERDHPRVARQQCPDCSSLATGAATVDDPQAAKTGLAGGIQIVAHQRGHLGRPEAVQIQHVGDRQFDRFVGILELVAHGLPACSAGQPAGCVRSVRLPKRMTTKTMIAEVTARLIQGLRP